MEVFFVALERVKRRVGRSVPHRVHALLGLSLAALGCEPPVKVNAFVEPESGRPYRVMTRGNHDATTPSAALFSLHAYNTAPDVVVDGYSLVRHVVKDRGWLLVVPEGKLDGAGSFHWNASAACCGEGKRDADDIGYLRAVLRDVEKRFAVDASRVYAFGVSNGAFMAHRWACAGQGDLTGIVSIAGAAPGPDDPPCAPTRPVSVVHVHGTHDDLIRFAGSNDPGRRYPSAHETVSRWVRDDALGDASTLTQRRSLFFTQVNVETWSRNGIRVSAWTFEKGDHLLRDARFFMADYLEAVAR